MPPAVGAPATSAGAAIVLTGSELALVDFGLELLQSTWERHDYDARAIGALRGRLLDAAEDGGREVGLGASGAGGRDIEAAVEPAVEVAASNGGQTRSARSRS
jgi:hypothetical protein